MLSESATQQQHGPASRDVRQADENHGTDEPDAGKREEEDWHASADVTSAFTKISLMPPPPAQDGGAYAEANFASQHALGTTGFDAQAVSPATANAASARHHPFDPVLIAGFENPRERLTVLKFEDLIIRFIRTSREKQLVFPPLSSYHRLIIHRLAQRFALEHQTAEYNSHMMQGYDGNGSRVVTLFKTMHTTIPGVLLIDLASDRQRAVSPAAAPKIIMRKRNAGRSKHGDGRLNAASENKSTRTMQDRERAYAEARARIFGEDTSSSSDTAASTEGTPVNHKVAGGKSTLGKKHVAKGPDGSKGFQQTQGEAKDHGRSPSGAQASASASGSTGNADLRRNTPTRAPALHMTKPSTDDGTVKKPQNWKESKVLWRNREQEMNDPDFTRNHDIYRPGYPGNRGMSPAPNTHAPNQRYGHPVGRYATPPPQMEYFDQQRVNYGYNAPQASHYGRRMNPGEYSRSETARPPPPPDYYCAQASHQVVPPPGPARGHRMSPAHGDTNPATRSAHPSTTAVNPSSCGYNDEFPPLGK